MGKYCCVIGCKSDWTPYSNISFHKFPKNKDLCSKWLEVINVTSVTEHKLVCSRHFKNEDFTEHTSIRRLKANSIPSYNLDIPEQYDSDNVYSVSDTESIKADDTALSAFNNCDNSPKPKKAPSPMLPVSKKNVMCRICLAKERDKKLYHMREQNILDLYEQLTGVEVGGTRPQHVCWECAHRLRTHTEFKNKALQANMLLETLPDENSYILISKQLKEHLSSKLKRIQSKTHPDIEYTFSNVKEEEYASDTAEEHPIYLDEEYIDESILKDESDIKDETQGHETFSMQNIIKLDSDDETLSTLKDKKKSTNILLSLLENTENNYKYDMPLSIENTKNIESSDRALRKRTRKLINDTKSMLKNTTKLENGECKFNNAKTDFNEDIINITTLSHEEQVSNMVKKRDSVRFMKANYKCMECYMGYMDEDIYNWHMSRHDIKNGPHQCDVCKLRFETHCKLKYHITSEHAMRFTCNKCPFVTSKRYSAKLHEGYHNGATFQCPYCTKTFGKISAYLCHVRTEHPSDCVCELCGYMFLGAKGVAYHKKLKHRSQQKPLEGPYCEVCDVRFATKEAHGRHLKLSSKHRSNQDSHPIPDCSQSIMKRMCRKRSAHGAGNPKKRRRTSTPPITIACEQCGVEMAGMRAYTQHFWRAHPSMRRTDHPLLRLRSKNGVMCELCGKLFRSACFLKQHMWAHRGAERPHACAECGRTFLYAHTAAAHRRAHAGLRPPAHACPDCGKLFAKRNNMQKHRFIHTGLKPFKCESCGKCFRTVHQQRAHFDHVHLKKPWPERPDRRRGKPLSHAED